MLISRDGAARKLVGLITRRSLVQIQLPQPFIYKGYRDFTEYENICFDSQFDSQNLRRIFIKPFND